MPSPEECSQVTQAECIRKFAVLETNQNNMTEQNKSIIEKLDLIVPAVKENSWWIEKIKWGFVMVAVVGVVMGVVSLIWN